MALGVGWILDGLEITIVRPYGTHVYGPPGRGRLEGTCPAGPGWLPPGLAVRPPGGTSTVLHWTQAVWSVIQNSPSSTL
jgi:hypothetical protein